MNSLYGADLAAWLRLVLTPGVGRATARKLITAFEWPTEIFAKSPSELAKVVSDKVVQALLSPPPELSEHIQRTEAWLNQSDNRYVVSLGCQYFPTALLDIEDPPVLLFAEGEISLISQSEFTPKAISIVGTRNPTPQGSQDAMSFASHLASKGFAIISGLALGVDAAAHEGALSADGKTIAVVATGLDLVYPKQHRSLAMRICDQGLLISEYLLATEPIAANFPQRNRIISGLSLGTLVVEAAVQSGSLITARMALEQGKEVFAIPGSIHSPMSKGCHLLIKQGAKLVETADDITEEFQGLFAVPLGTNVQQVLFNEVTQKSQKELSPAQEDFLENMGYAPISLENLQNISGLDIANLQVKLLDLELAGQIARMPGGRFQRVSSS